MLVIIAAKGRSDVGARDHVVRIVNVMVSSVNILTQEKG